MYCPSAARMMPVVSADDTLWVARSMEPSPGSVAGSTSPESSWIAGESPEASAPAQPMLILTGTTWPPLTLLYTPAVSGGRNALSRATTAAELNGAEIPLSLSLACAVTWFVPQVAYWVVNWFDPLYVP